MVRYPRAIIAEILQIGNISVVPRVGYRPANRARMRQPPEAGCQARTARHGAPGGPSPRTGARELLRPRPSPSRRTPISRGTQPADPVPSLLSSPGPGEQARLIRVADREGDRVRYINELSLVPAAEV